MKSVKQNIRGFIERLLRATKEVLWSRMQPSDHNMVENH